VYIIEILFKFCESVLLHLILFFQMSYTAPLKNSAFSRLVYGQVKDFKSTAYGVKLYKFAHEIQIDALKEDLVEFFKPTPSPLKSSLSLTFALQVAIKWDWTIIAKW
jgi:hypothetical protein